jgi:hypothetical protein
MEHAMMKTFIEQTYHFVYKPEHVIWNPDKTTKTHKFFWYRPMSFLEREFVYDVAAGRFRQCGDGAVPVCVWDPQMEDCFA